MEHVTVFNSVAVAKITVRGTFYTAVISTHTMVANMGETGKNKKI